MQKSLLLHGGTVVNHDVDIRDDVLIRDGVIDEIDRYVEEYDEEMDVTDKLLMPGLIDCHVHFREPGLEHKATMKSESDAAFAGGVTAVCEMPNTVPPTVTVAALADKIRRASEISNVDMRFFFGATQDIHLATLRELLDGTSEESKRIRAGMCGLKIYLDHSTGDQKIADALMDDAFKLCADHNIVLVAHCEDAQSNTEAATQNTRTNIAAHSLIRTAQSEAIAVERAIRLARAHGTRLHIAHLSSENGLALVRQAKAEGLKVTCEVTPHHLFLTTDDYERLGTFAKMNPPLRSIEHRFALWQGIADGTVDCIATDHAPHTIDEKKSAEPLKAPSGVPGVETMLPLLLSVAAGHWPHPMEGSMSCPTLTYKDIVRLCHTHPNKLFGLGKSDIEENKKTDIVIVDPAAQWTIEAAKLHSKCGWTPYEGWTVKGKVEKVLKA